MGIIKAVMKAAGQTLADSWQEVIEPNDMGERTVFTSGVLMRRGQNVKGTGNTITNGSVIHVYDNQMMLLVDGGKVVDYTAEPGYYTVNNATMPSLFNGEFGESLNDAFNRVKFGGSTPAVQKVFFINLQEIKGIKFGTRNPINYFDNFYNAELFLRAHGTYSIRITNPLQFYAEAIPRNAEKVEIEQINEQYMNEFLQALQSAINQMSADGIRISHVTSKALELGRYMANILDEEWGKQRGIEIQAVGLGSISYDEESKRLIQMRNEGAMLGTDFNVMRGVAVKNMTEGIKNAGSNAGGAMNGFMGVGMGMNHMNAVLGGFGDIQTPNDMQNRTMAEPVSQKAQETGWKCECGQTNTGKFCGNCGKPAPISKKPWTCTCGQLNEGKFCSNCGKPALPAEWICVCGQKNEGKFCSNCGKARE